MVTQRTASMCPGSETGMSVTWKKHERPIVTEPRYRGGGSYRKWPWWGGQGHVDRVKG